MNPALLLREARIPGVDRAVDVLLRDGLVVSIDAVGATAARDAEQVSLEGRMLLPGLWDEHVHMTQHVIRRQRFDLADTESAAAVLERVRTEAAARELPAGELLMGYGFRDGLWADAPTLAGIDAAAPTQAVALVSGDLHCAWVNTLAARLLGVDPGESGIVSERVWMDASSRLEASRELPMSAYREAAEAAARRGVVGIVEFESADNVGEWRERVAAGVDLLRVEASVWPDRLEAAIAAGWRTGDPVDPAGLVRMGPLKVIVDGSLNTRTAWCWDPYPGLDPRGADAHGVVAIPPEELRGLMTSARDNGIAAAIHAIGDHANTAVLDAFAALGMTGRVEHAQLLTERDIPRFAQLGIVASVQPEHAMDDRDVAERYWAGRTGRAFPLAALHAAGTELRFGSDAPVAPLDPWVAIAAATARSRGDREPWHPEQRIPFGVALAASTRGRTRVRTGESADLVVVDHDPATLGRDALRELPVSATLMAGRFTHRTL